MHSDNLAAFQAILSHPGRSTTCQSDAEHQTGESERTSFEAAGETNTQKAGFSMLTRAVARAASSMSNGTRTSHVHASHFNPTPAIHSDHY
jgi:hypothetical protein